MSDDVSTEDVEEIKDEWPFNESLSEGKIKYQQQLFAMHPLFKLLNFSDAEYEFGYTKFSLPWQQDLSNYGYEIHGGIHATMIDSVTAQAIFTGLKRGYRLTTVHIEARYFRPFSEGLMVAEGRVLKWGKAICHAEAKLTVGDELVASGSTVYAVIDPSRRKK